MADQYYSQNGNAGDSYRGESYQGAGHARGAQSPYGAPLMRARAEVARSPYDDPRYDAPYEDPAPAYGAQLNQAQFSPAQSNPAQSRTLPPSLRAEAAPPVGRLRPEYHGGPSYAPPPDQPIYAQQNYAPPSYAPPSAEAGDFSDFRAAVAPAFVQRALHWAGALASIAAVVGAVMWGYDLAMRDANGIPVVRAATGPLRVAPATPGGDISENQGLAVNSIPAEGVASAVPDAVTLAPLPVALAEEDLSPTAQSAADEAPAALSDLAAALPEDMPLSDEEAVERALEMALAEGGDGPLEAAAEPASAPAPEPVTMASPAAPLAQQDAALPAAAEIDPSTLAAGTKLVQLGAFDTADVARAEWARLQDRFAPLMGGKAMVIEPAKSGGRQFFRLRAHGFENEDETRRFCAALLAENASCIPVAQR